MIYLAITTAVGYAVLGYVIFHLLSKSDIAEARWSKKESELLNRIQRPELIPARDVPKADPKVLERQQRIQQQLSQVGQVKHGG